MFHSAQNQPVKTQAKVNWSGRKTGNPIPILYKYNDYVKLYHQAWLREINYQCRKKRCYLAVHLTPKQNTSEPQNSSGYLEPV